MNLLLEVLVVLITLLCCDLIGEYCDYLLFWFFSNDFLTEFWPKIILLKYAQKKGHWRICYDEAWCIFLYRSRSRSRRRDRTFRCTDCKDRAYETEKGLKVHKQRYCGKPREEGAFPCTACDKVFVTAGLLKMHMGRFHTDRSASRVRGSTGVNIYSKMNNFALPIVIFFHGCAAACPYMWQDMNFCLTCLKYFLPFLENIFA